MVKSRACDPPVLVAAIFCSAEAMRSETMFFLRTQSKTILQAVTMMLCVGTMEAQIILNHRDLPQRVGDRMNTKIDWVGTRMPIPAPGTFPPGVHDFDPGSGVVLINGGSQVGYE